ncbi:mitochondrial transcription rescue factor 1 [Wyeomyia smithii]|uniref:mitochondrial transcription rescue factor 1 n=1 Tax=Wyeomyia smithii TaxID=174621 RepID=UPI002467D5F4|nr:mitochondrial transcription rescue factor 1 [Wyeomyia smithii]
MSLIIKNRLNLSTFRLLKTYLPQASYCSLERTTRHLTIHKQEQESPFGTTGALVKSYTLQQVRWKSKKSNRKDRTQPAKDDVDDEDSDEDQSDVFEELANDKHTKLLKTSVGSMRADLIVKAGLGIARNKVDTLFYESKIRVNGRKLLKKSTMLDAGDEVDVVKGPSPNNPDHLIVSRVEILDVTPKSESIGIVMRRHKSLIIESYETDGSGDK